MRATRANTNGAYAREDQKSIAERTDTCRGRPAGIPEPAEQRHDDAALAKRRVRASARRGRVGRNPDVRRTKSSDDDARLLADPGRTIGGRQEHEDKVRDCVWAETTTERKNTRDRVALAGHGGGAGAGVGVGTDVCGAYRVFRGLELGKVRTSTAYRRLYNGCFPGEVRAFDDADYVAVYGGETCSEWRAFCIVKPALVYRLRDGSARRHSPSWPAKPLERRLPPTALVRYDIVDLPSPSASERD